MTLHALRGRMGDAPFFTLLRKWIKLQSGGLVTTAELMDLAEQVSGQDLDAFVDKWLYTAAKPAGIGDKPLAASTGASATALVERLVSSCRC